MGNKVVYIEITRKTTSYYSQKDISKFDKKLPLKCTRWHQQDRQSRRYWLSFLTEKTRVIQLSMSKNSLERLKSPVKSLQQHSGAKCRVESHGKCGWRNWNSWDVSGSKEQRWRVELSVSAMWWVPSWSSWRTLAAPTIATESE